MPFTEPAQIVFALVTYPDAGETLVLSLASDWREERRVSDDYPDEVYEQIEGAFERLGIEAFELTESTYEIVTPAAEIRAKLDADPNFIYDAEFERFAAGPAS